VNKIAYQSGCTAAVAAFKLAEWNWELTGRPTKKDDISSDNGRRAYGTSFTEPGRQNREVGKAFDQLNTTRPSDFLNAGNEAMIGTMV
jgi:hypothetical protein